MPDFDQHEAGNDERRRIHPQRRRQTDERQQVVEDALLRMEHHRPYERDRDRCRHHRHDENASQHASERELAVEDHRGGRSQHERGDDGERREVERVNDRFEKALVGGERRIIAEADEMRGGSDLPLERAHPQREQPRKQDDGADDHQRRHDEEVIAAAPTREKLRASRREGDRRHRSGGCGAGARAARWKLTAGPRASGSSVSPSRPCREPAGTRRSPSSVLRPHRRR